MLLRHPFHGFWVVLLLFFGLMAPATAQPRDEGSYQILGARYGTLESNVDVTDRLRQLARSDRSFRVTNEVFGADPDRGRTKALRIYARGRDGGTRTFEYREGATVDGSQFIGWQRGSWGQGGRNQGWQGNDGRYNRGRDDGELSILQAIYGTPERHVDVTQRLRELARNDRAIQLTNSTFGVDPHPYRTKTLRIYVRDRDGQTQLLEFAEGKTIDGARFSGWAGGNWGRDGWNGGWLGVVNPGGYPQGGGYYRDQRNALEVLNAVYGAEGRMVDVTGALRSIVRDDRLEVRVTNDLCRCDPAPRVTKTLWVTYSVGGRQQQASVREGDDLVLP